MMIDIIDDRKEYNKATLIQVLEEARTPDLPVTATYKAILRREKKKIPVYMNSRRDPANGYRLYTGRQIRKILEYEIDFATKRIESKKEGQAKKEAKARKDAK